MKIHHHASSLLAITAASLVWSGPSAFAAESVAANTATTEAGGAGEAAPFGTDIVISARRKDERIQDVPVAANAFGAEELTAARVYNLRDLQALAPSLVVTVTNPRNTSINIRGLGNNVSVYNDGLEPAVGVYTDQVYLGRPGQAVFDLADIERIEVLRGPQGTLFGKNTSAGAVVITTKAPGPDLEFGGDVTVANHGYRQFHAYANVPLVTDELAARLYVSKTDRDGFVTNRYDGARTQDYHDWGLRGQVQLTPAGSGFKLRVIGDYAQQRSATAAAVITGVIRNYDNGALFANNFTDRAQRLGYTPPAITPGARIVDVDANPRYKMSQGGISAIADLRLDRHTLTSVTAYRFWNWYPHNDGDQTPFDAGRDFHQSNEQQQFSQELRLASSGTRKIDYVAGLYYFWQNIDAESVNAYGRDAGRWFAAPSVRPAVASAALDEFLILSRSRPVTRSFAAFAQTVWHITPLIDLTTGLRYTYERKTGWFDQKVSGQSLANLSAADAAQALSLRNRYGTDNYFEAESKAGRLSGQVTLSWKITPDVLAYATYTRGNKFGGLNLSNLTTTGPYAANPVIAPETIDTYEVGLKTAWFNNKLTANLAGFWNNVKGFQTTFVDYDRNNLTFFTNAGSVRTRGFETDLRANPARWLSLYGSAAYTDAIYVSYANAPCPIEVTGQTSCNLDGRPLPGVSKWALTAGGEVRAPLGALLGRDTELYVGGDNSYRSSYNTSSSLSRYAQIPGYVLANARIGLRSADGLFDVQIWARNLFNKDYYLSLSSNNTGLIQSTLGEPRTYGVTVKTRI